MPNKLGQKLSVILLVLATFFVLPTILVHITVKSHTHDDGAEPVTSSITAPNNEEPKLKVLKPTLPGTPGIPASESPDTKLASQIEPNYPPVTSPPDLINTAKIYGMVPVFYNVKTTQPVVFLTIDDGAVKDYEATVFMNRHHLVATLFLNDSKISDNYNFFRSLQSAGNPIENHTVNHHDLTKLSYVQQKKEICDNADTFSRVFGKRPTLFRPPYGAFNDNTRRAAADCGMTALIHWHAKANGGSIQYQQGDKLQPGDIVLMHFRKEVLADLTAFTDAAQKAHLQTVLLENWIK